MRNASGQQGEASKVKMSRSEKKSEQERKQQNLSVWWAHRTFFFSENVLLVSFTLWSCKTTAKKYAKKSVLHVQSCFFVANLTTDFFKFSLPLSF